MIGLVHGGRSDDGRSGGVAFGGFGAAFQLGLFQLGLPLSDLLIGNRLALFAPLLDVGLRGCEFRMILCDAFLDAVQMNLDVLLSGSRLAVDFGLQRLHIVVNARELDAEIFAELINTFVHDVYS